MTLLRRKSIRFKGYNYAEPGWYFVTICTQGRSCVFGEVVGGKMRLSEIGEVVESCWQEMPEHFPTVKTGTFQIMPNHVHGVVEIKEKNKLNDNVRTRHTESVQEQGMGAQFGKPRAGSLSTIIGSFKSAVTKKVHAQRLRSGLVWHSRFYDRIIRSDVERFFIEQYIELNPIMWELDVNNPNARSMSDEALRKYLKEEHGLDGFVLERVIDYKLGIEILA